MVSMLPRRSATVPTHQVGSSADRREEGEAGEAGRREEGEAGEADRREEGEAGEADRMEEGEEITQVDEQDEPVGRMMSASASSRVGSRKCGRVESTM